MSPSQPLQFSFGPAGHKAPAGYTAVATAVYSSTVGYGWDSATKVYTGGNYAAGTPPLAGTFAYGINGTFHVDVPNGTYDVTLTLENSLSSSTANVVNVIINGQRVELGLAVASKQVVNRTYRGNVSNGRLDISLATASGYSYWSLCGLSIAKVPLTVDAGPDQTVTAGSSVSFPSSVVGGSPPYLLIWDFDDSTTAPTYTYAKPGVYNAVLTVVDGDGVQVANSAMITVQDAAPVDPVAPTVSLQTPSPGTVGAAVNLAATATSIQPQEPPMSFIYHWDFGDGTTGAGANTSHTYTAPGTYTISVTATDSLGKTSAPATATIVIAPAAPPDVPPVAGSVNIDAGWLAPRGDGPYLLNQDNTIYVLKTDVTVPGVGFQVTAKNVTLDLNGHTITYDNAAPIAPVTNGGFETGDLTGWDVSQAPGAVVVPAITGMWGNSMLQLPKISSTQVITSSQVSIPTAGIPYAATITPKCNLYTTLVTVAVVDTVTNAVLGSATLAPSRGVSPVALFTPKTTNPVLLQVTVAPPAGATDTVMMDYALITRANRPGIVQGPTLNCPGFTVKNGSVVQGQGNSYASSPLQYGVVGVTVDGLRLEAGGMDTSIINATWGGNLIVKNSTLIGHMDRFSNRMALFAAIQALRVTGFVQIQNNTISGTLDTGITFTRGVFGDHSGIKINDNTITHESLCTDGYAILFENGTSDFEVARNTITPVNGRGIMLDNYAVDGEVHHNTITVREHANLEYPKTAMETTALRLRSYQFAQRNLNIHDNTFVAYTDADGLWAATGARIMAQNVGGVNNNANVVFTNNLFKAIVLGIDPTLGGSSKNTAWGLTLSEVWDGTGLTFVGNTFESNVVSLNFGDNDSWSKPENGITFLGNTCKKSSEGVVMPYSSIHVGDWNNGASNLRFIDMQYAGGATPASLTFLGGLAKDVETGYVLGVSAVDAQSHPVAGATVEVKDKDGNTLFTGTTDAQGLASGIPVPTTKIAQTGTNPAVLTTTTLNPITVTVTHSAQSLPQTITLTHNDSLTFTFS